MQEKSRDFGKLNMCFTMALWLVMCGLAMTVMLWFSANKTIVIADGAAEKSGNAQIPAQERALVLERTDGVSGSFSVLLPQNVKAGNIVMENHYMVGELWLHIKTDSDSFYDECIITGDVSSILQGSCGKQQDGVLLKLEMAQMYEYKSTMEGNTLVITYDAPWEVYKRIVVLDPMGGGTESGLVATTQSGDRVSEKNVALQVAKQVQKRLSMEGVKVYLTRTDDSYVSESRRLELLEASGADMYIRIGVASDAESPEQYGIGSLYNGEFYLPGFGNVQLADIITREVTIASGNCAVGLTSAGEESILQTIEIPATELLLGYFSNEQERELLSRESYREKLADGIVNAITKACESLNQIEEK